MLQKLPLSVKITLLEVLNSVWRSGEFPTNWRTAVIVPIPKPNCNDSEPASFRPISLTSCMAKVFERIVNRRLVTELETNGRLDKRQHAFRAGRGTDTYFADLERSFPVDGEHCLIASLDLSKAYDTTWRHGILRTLRSWQIRGRMFNMLQSFLSERKFQVRVGEHLSGPRLLENGVPQGSVLSVTLFLVAMQPLFRVIPIGVDVILYADDILLVIKRRKNEQLHRKLQAAVKAVDKWAKGVGFTISSTKSQTFYCSPNARRDPVRNITIDGTVVPKTKRLRVLGVTLDRTLNFKAHCKIVKKSCESRLRILQMIGAKLPRGKRTTLLQVGSSIVTSKLLYGVGLVSRGGSAALQILTPAYNRTIRFASGAFVTSPIVSIMAEAGTLPFDLLVAQSIARIAIRILEKDRSSIDLPLIRRASGRIETLTGTALPNIGNITRRSEREWYTAKPSIFWDVKEKVSAGESPEIVRPIVQQLLSDRFRHSTVIYTDGSKSEDTVGAGLFANGLTMSASLPQSCSVFSAEAYALQMAVSIPNITREMVVMTDSASCLLALEAGKSKHPWIQQVESIARSKRVHFCWIPGHAGVHGNMQADRLANEARSNDPTDVPIPAEDAVRAIKTQIRQNWDGQWYALQEVKLREIKDDTQKWMDRDNAADQRVLTRLRIGHTRLTHTFLIDKSEPPMCECCGETVTVRHLLLDCRKYDEMRSRCGIETTGLRAALKNDNDTETRMLQFLKETQLYRKL